MPAATAPGRPVPWPLWAAWAGGLLWLLPTLADLAAGPWQDPLHSHGPVIVAVANWLAWQRWRAWQHGVQAPPSPGARRMGAALLLLAALLAGLGRWGEQALLQAAALPPALAGLALWQGGRPLLRALAFPVGFLLFAVPMPAALAEALTQPMKLGVSWAAVSLLDALGYAVSLDGVVIGIGPYRLLVADACAGLNSLLMLEAFGLLYLHLVRHPSTRRTLVLALAIVPIALAANVLRVLLLALVTFHFGEAAGQGLVHGASGVILFVAGLAMIWPLDQLLRRWSSQPAPAAEAAPAPPLGPPRSTLAPRPAHLLLLWAVAALTAWGPLPAAPVPAADPLESWFPAALGDWQALPSRGQAQVAALLGTEQVYDDQLVRTYRHADGRQVMLTLAYVAQQRRLARIHEPPACYAAAGFQLQREPRQSLMLDSHAVQAQRLLARRDGRHEAVLWWVRLGALQDTPSQTVTAWRLFTARLRGEVPDGLLVRASALVPAGAADGAAGYAAAEDFLRAMTAALGDQPRRALLLR